MIKYLYTIVIFLSILKKTNPTGTVGVVVIFGQNFRSIIATAGADRYIRIWDEVTGSLYTLLQGHLDSVYDMTFYCVDDVILMVTASADTTVRVWDVLRAECLATLLGHDDVVTGVIISTSPNLMIMSSSLDCTVKFWDFGLLIDRYYRSWLRWNRNKQPLLRNRRAPLDPDFTYVPSSELGKDKYSLVHEGSDDSDEDSDEEDEEEPEYSADATVINVEGNEGLGTVDLMPAELVSSPDNVPVKSKKRRGSVMEMLGLERATPKQEFAKSTSKAKTTPKGGRGRRVSLATEGRNIQWAFLDANMAKSKATMENKLKAKKLLQERINARKGLSTNKDEMEKSANIIVKSQKLEEAALAAERARLSLNENQSLASRKLKERLMNSRKKKENSLNSPKVKPFQEDDIDAQNQAYEQLRGQLKGR